MVNGGCLNHVSGNLFFNIDRPVCMVRGNNKPSESEPWMVRRYLKMIAGNPLFQKYPYSQEAAQVPKEKWDEELTLPRHNMIVGNAFVGCGGMKLDPAVALSGTVSGNRVYPSAAVAGMVDAARRDYSLRGDSPVFTDLPGFPAIPFRHIGRAGLFDPLTMEFEDFDMSGGNCIPAMENGVLCGKVAKGTGTGRKEFRGPLWLLRYHRSLQGYRGRSRRPGTLCRRKADRLLDIGSGRRRLARTLHAIRAGPGAG